jgi:hypothetical protein
METVKDDLGRPWRLSVNAVTIERVRADTGVDLLEFGMDGPSDLVENSIFFRFRADPILLAKVMFSLCASEAEKAGIDWANFGAQFTGDTLNAGRVAVETEIGNFTQDPKTREAIKKAIADLQKVMDMGAAKIAAKMTDPRIQAANENELKKLDASLEDSLDSLVSLSQEPLPSGS